MAPFAFRRMRVYQLSLRLVGRLYSETRGMPADARPIVWQLLRSTVSIGLNIAEGAGEIRRPEKARFYRMARRSSWEAMASLDMLGEIGAMESGRLQSVEAVLAEIGAMLSGLIRYQETVDARQSITRSARKRDRSTPPATDPI